jgi:P27 family predicted phage terminase small subunit
VSPPSPSSAKVIELRGNPSKVNVERRAEKEVRPDPIVPTAPDWLPPRARSIWRYLSPELERDALLTKRDRETFAFLCAEAALAVDCLQAMRPDRRKGFVVLEVDKSQQDRTRRHPALIAYGASVQRYLLLAREFGLSPRMRLPLEVGPDAPADDGDDEDDELFDG